MEASRRRPGLVRSPLQPEETAGLTRSGDLSRMLPAEAHLLAAGWPRAASHGGAVLWQHLGLRIYMRLLL